MCNHFTPSLDKIEQEQAIDNESLIVWMDTERYMFEQDVNRLEIITDQSGRALHPLD